MATPPAVKLRLRDATRYQATIGRTKSPALKLSRRLSLYSVSTALHGNVKITGRLTLPLATPAAALVVTRRDTCGSGYKTLKAKVTLNHHSGTFTVAAPAPPASAPGAVYELKTRVALKAHSRKSYATDSLPRPIGH